MPILSVTGLKGGVGKSVLIHNLAGAFALSGKKVLCIDNDSQSSLSSGVFGPTAVEGFDPGTTIAALYADLDPLPERIIRPSGVDRIDVIAGSLTASRYNLPEPFAAPVELQTCLRSFLVEVLGEYNYILIDNPPNLQLANWASLVASDYSLAPITPEDYSSMSLSPALEAVRQAADGPNPRLHLLGLVLTLVQPRLGVHAAYERVLRELHGDAVFETRIPASAEVKEAISRRLPVTHYKPRGASAKAFKALAEEILSRIEALRHKEAA